MSKKEIEPHAGVTLLIIRCLVATEPPSAMVLTLILLFSLCRPVSSVVVSLNLTLDCPIDASFYERYPGFVFNGSITIRESWKWRQDRIAPRVKLFERGIHKGSPIKIQIKSEDVIPGGLYHVYPALVIFHNCPLSPMTVGFFYKLPKCSVALRECGYNIYAGLTYMSEMRIKELNQVDYVILESDYYK